MALRYNSVTGKFEDTDANTVRVSQNLRYNNETGEFEPANAPAQRRRGRRPADAETEARRAEAEARRLAAAARRDAAAARAREERRRYIFIRALCAMLVIDALVLVFGGGGNVLLAVTAIFFLPWFAYRLVTGAIWPWIVLGGIALGVILSI